MTYVTVKSLASGQSAGTSTGVKPNEVKAAVADLKARLSSGR